MIFPLLVGLALSTGQFEIVATSQDPPPKPLPVATPAGSETNAPSVVLQPPAVLKWKPREDMKDVLQQIVAQSPDTPSVPPKPDRESKSETSPPTEVWQVIEFPANPLKPGSIGKLKTCLPAPALGQVSNVTGTPSKPGSPGKLEPCVAATGADAGSGPAALQAPVLPELKPLPPAPLPTKPAGIPGYCTWEDEVPLEAPRRDIPPPPPAYRVAETKSVELVASPPSELRGNLLLPVAPRPDIPPTPPANKVAELKNVEPVVRPSSEIHGSLLLPVAPIVDRNIRQAESQSLPAVKAGPQPEVVPAMVQTSEPPRADAAILPVSASVGGCPTCGSRAIVGGHMGALPPYDSMSSSACCGRGPCAPGRKPCYPCESHTVLGGFLCDLYECICCPDPCYDPVWIAQANSAFFVEGARPISHMRLRWDAARNLQFPDRSEFFWARADGKGLGPAPVGALGVGRVKYDELNMYVETALGAFSTFIEYPYRSIDPEFGNHASGFTDMSIGTKTLLFDCELLQITFQLKTTIPTGNVLRGLGVGHASLEPSGLFALKLHHDTYLQGQISEWIPLGGDQNYAGSIFHAHLSLNHVLCRVVPDVPLIGTFEVSNWDFQHGSYTDPILGPFQKSSGGVYVSMGPGLRLVVCDKIDFGVGTQFSLTQANFAQTLVRMEFRVRW